MIDFHCHLDLYPDPKSVVARCHQERLYILSVTTVPSAYEGTAALAPPNGRIRTALGLHPELVATRAHELPLFEKLLTRTRYVGEVGLDGSRPHRASLDQQSGVLRDILKMCSRAGGKTLSLHSRSAASEVLDLLSQVPGAGVFVLHLFTGTKRQVERAAELGCWFSINPAMFSSERGKEALSTMPMDRVLPESDGPFGMANGVPQSPWGAWSIVPDLAECWHQPVNEVAKRLKANFKRLVTV